MKMTKNDLPLPFDGKAEKTLDRPVFEKLPSKTLGKMGVFLDYPQLCHLCQRDIDPKPCTYKNCDNFEYRKSVNYLCDNCKNDCKQHSFVKILQCKKYTKKT